MENGKQRAVAVHCLLLTAYCLLPSTFCLLNAAPAPQGVLSPLKAVELPFPPGERSIQRLWLPPNGKVYGIILNRPIKFGMKKLGQLFQYNPPTGHIESLEQLPEPFPPLQNESILFGGGHAWAWDKSWERYYVLSFGWMSLAGENFSRDLGQIAGARPFEEKLEGRQGYQVSRAIVFDSEDIPYTAGKDGFIFRYSPSTEKLEQLPARLPAIQGREAWASLDAAALGPDGLIYGGTFDGYIFTFNPKTLEVINLGKPLRQQRIQGLAFSKGKLYGVGGEEDGLPRAFAFDPKTRGFELGGTLKTTDGKIILDPIGAMVADKDGNIYIGTTGRLGNFYVWERLAR